MPINNDHTNARRHHSLRPGYERKPEDVLSTITFDVERKTFSITARRNHAGKFLRLTEINGTRCTHVIIPESGFRALRDGLDQMANHFPEEAGA